MERVVSLKGTTPATLLECTRKQMRHRIAKKGNSRTLRIALWCMLLPHPPLAFILSFSRPRSRSLSDFSPTRLLASPIRLCIAFHPTCAFCFHYFIPYIIIPCWPGGEDLSITHKLSEQTSVTSHAFFELLHLNDNNRV